MKRSLLNVLLLSLVLALIWVSSWGNGAIASPVAFSSSVLAQTTEPPPTAPTQPAGVPPSPTEKVTDSAQPTADHPPVEPKSEEETASPETLTPESQPLQPGGPYDMKGIEEFYKSLYGS